MDFIWKSSQMEDMEILFSRHKWNTAIVFWNKKEKCESKPIIMINLTLIRVNAEEYDIVKYDETQIIYFRVSMEKFEGKKWDIDKIYNEI